MGDGSQPGADPRTVFAERIGEVGHVSVSFGDEDPLQLRLDCPTSCCNASPRQAMTALATTSVCA